jgi:hypothetical protein
MKIITAPAMIICPNAANMTKAMDASMESPIMPYTIFHALMRRADQPPGGASCH